ncbi:uncharacterized protein LOC124365293 [Homalodisca vitripennis]|uniref:uncharacterized protein LOC124365293 n=1 Tax=Homalodisca vitripennis TaxID=197043 RepID=UPI001EEB304F|nr:uncharacterized protein LOC124365293 [Homalodisca vitripennis]
MLLRRQVIRRDDRIGQSDMSFSITFSMESRPGSNFQNLAVSRCNGMSSNASKAKLMTFKRTTSTIGFNYSLDDKLLDHCTSIKDLGIVLDSSFGYSLYIDQLCCRASSMMGQIMRTARHGLSSNALVLSCKSLVLQLLEYASVVRSPHQLGLIDRLQSAQNKFLRYLDWREPDRHLNLLRLHPLVVRREIADVVFLYKILNFEVVCPLSWSELYFVSILPQV